MWASASLEPLARLRERGTGEGVRVANVYWADTHKTARDARPSLQLSPASGREGEQQRLAQWLEQLGNIVFVEPGGQGGFGIADHAFE